MGWEKHDNEIRNALQEGTRFLPEEESWDATAAWQKMQRHMAAHDNTASVPKATQLSSKNRWWFAAAALLLLMGIGILWKTIPVSIPQVIAPAQMANTPAPAIEVKKDDSSAPNLIAAETTAVPPSLDTRSNPRRFGVTGEIIPADQPGIGNGIVNTIPEDASTVPSQANDAPDTLPTLAAATSEAPQPSIIDLQDSNTIRTTVKIKKGIIHLNELGYDGMQAPGFSPRKRYNAREIMARQTTTSDVLNPPATKRNGITIPF